MKKKRFVANSTPANNSYKHPKRRANTWQIGHK